MFHDLVMLCVLDGPGIESRWRRDFTNLLRTALVPTQPLYNDYWVSYPEVKRPGHGVDYPTPSSAKVKERVDLYLYSPCRPPCPLLGWTLHSPLNFPEIKTTSGGYSLGLSDCEVQYYHGTSFL